VEWQAGLVPEYQIKQLKQTNYVPTQADLASKEFVPIAPALEQLKKETEIKGKNLENIKTGAETKLTEAKTLYEGVKTAGETHRNRMEQYRWRDFLDKKLELLSAQIEKEKQGAQEKGSKLTDYNRRAGAMALLLNDANTQLEQLYNNGFDPTTTSVWVQQHYPEWAEQWKTNDLKYYEQIQRSFVNTIARFWSGAEIKDSEYPKFRDMLFEKMGDPDAVRQQKKIARQNIFNGLVSASNSAYGEALKVGSGENGRMTTDELFNAVKNNKFPDAGLQIKTQGNMPEQPTTQGISIDDMLNANPKAFGGNVGIDTRFPITPIAKKEAKDGTRRK
jgi:hypothetical protein